MGREVRFLQTYIIFVDVQEIHFPLQMKEAPPEESIFPMLECINAICQLSL